LIVILASVNVVAPTPSKISTGGQRPAASA